MTDYKVFLYDSVGEPMREIAFISSSDGEALYLTRVAMPLRARAELWSGPRHLGRLDGPLSPLKTVAAETEGAPDSWSGSHACLGVV